MYKSKAAAERAYRAYRDKNIPRSRGLTYESW
jgi:hypothetical protein